MVGFLFPVVDYLPHISLWHMIFLKGTVPTKVARLDSHDTSCLQYKSPYIYLIFDTVFRSLLGAILR